MFVEITRLFIVLLATLAGYTLGRGGAHQAVSGNGAVVGATLGACIGYVGGGVLGRLLEGGVDAVEQHVEEEQPGRLLAGALGALVVGGLCGLVGAPFVILLPGLWGWPALGLLVWLGVYGGFRLGARKFEELLALLGLSTRPLARAAPYGPEAEANLVDASAIIDGRLLAVARAGFIRGPLLVPRFVVDEVQAVADSPDPAKRRRGRRGLDLLDVLRRHPGIDLNVLDDEVVEHDAIDAKIVALARRLKSGLITVDDSLQRAAELQGVRCLSLHRLAEGLRPVHVTGEVIRLPISREGKERGQGVGFLDDGTMVVVNDGAELVGREVDVRITGSARTALGTMLFAAVSEVTSPR